MLQIVSSLLIAAAVTAAQGPTPPPTVPPTEGDAVRIMSSRTMRNVDCAGHDLIVGGDDDKLQVVNCRDIEVAGSRNRIRAKLMADSYISASGDKNNITYIPIPGIEALARSTGHGNEINSPPMAVDVKNNIPFKPPRALRPPG